LKSPQEIVIPQLWHSFNCRDMLSRKSHAMPSTASILTLKKEV